MPPAHVWFYISEGAISDQQVGPINEGDLISLFREGKLNLAVQVSSPTRTHNRWIPAQQVPGLISAVQEGLALRKQEAEERHRLAEQARREKQQAADAQAQHREAQRAQAEEQEVGHLRGVCEQNLHRAAPIFEAVKGLLTSSERVEFLAIQEWPLLDVLNLRPDAVIVTNRRLIFYRPKLFWRYEFRDFLWLQIGNAHLEKQLLGAVFAATHLSDGRPIVMTLLPQTAAERLYRIAQEREEQAIEWRRQRGMEERRAGAANVAVNASMPPPPAPAAPSVDPASRLASLKGMLDQGLISADDFQRRKAEILASV